MNKYERITLHGRFKEKKIELAPTEGMDMFQSIADDFMEAIFSMAPGFYLITDESSLRDFKGVEDMELADMYHKILDVYGVDVSDITCGNLIEIFARIHKYTSGQPT